MESRQNVKCLSEALLVHISSILRYVYTTVLTRSKEDTAITEGYQDALDVPVLVQGTKEYAPTKHNKKTTCTMTALTPNTY